MIIIDNKQLKGFSKNEEYIIGKSLIDAWGYPYRITTIKMLGNRDEYKIVDDRFTQSNYILELVDIEIVINALELLYFDNGDFDALYDGVTKDDVKTLYKKLKQITEIKK